MNFLPQLVPPMSTSARAEATLPATARPQAAATRVRRPAAAAVSASASKAARCLWLPKRGFNNIFAQPLDALNVSVLDKFEDGAVVDVQAILDAGIISKCKYGIKFLGNGEVTKKLTVKAAAFSETAKQKIEAAGGKAEVV